jgi:hypothetical protein
MSLLKLKLPETLHSQLNIIAQNENISINQYVIYALTRHITSAYTVQPVSNSLINNQLDDFKELLQNLGQTTLEEAKLILDEREKVNPEKELYPEVIKDLQKQINNELL